ncbi:MAG: two-component system response regulator [Planctomycetaceae bacterium]|nr:two-component system response regulator [Planctomycetaceae bacterium]
MQGMPDGVVLIDADKTILWGNGRLREWSGEETVVGEDFYHVLGSPEILGPDFCPFSTALSSGQPSASTLRTEGNRFYRLHAAPVVEGDRDPQLLVVTIRDVSDEVLQQQKMVAIHQAGLALADIRPDEVSDLEYDERVELLQDNILHCVQDVLQLDVIEIRMLDQQSGELYPVMEVGMAPAAAQRKLFAQESGNGVTGFVAATGKSYVCGHTTEDPLYLEGAQGARSSLTVPLTLDDEVIGTLNVESPEANAFNESDLQFMEIFARSVATALNTLELLAAEKASTAAASVEAIHSAVALPVDVILNDAVNVMERYIGHEPDVVARLQRILANARDIKKAIQKVGRKMAPTQAHPGGLADEVRPLLAGRRVLVVDEDETVRSAAHELLERYHTIVETAHDGKEACAMVRNLSADAHYDVIIADIRLPDMNGYDFLVALREILDDVPLVLMTGFGYDPGHSIVKARREGLKSVLYKPFRLDQLVSTIEGIVREARANRKPHEGEGI